MGNEVLHFDQSKYFESENHRNLVSFLARFGLGIIFLIWIIQIYNNNDSIVAKNLVGSRYRAG